MHDLVLYFELLSPVCYLQIIDSNDAALLIEPLIHNFKTQLICSSPFNLLAKPVSSLLLSQSKILQVLVANMSKTTSSSKSIDSCTKNNNFKTTGMAKLEWKSRLLLHLQSVGIFFYLGRYSGATESKNKDTDWLSLKPADNCSLMHQLSYCFSKDSWSEVLELVTASSEVFNTDHYGGVLINNLLQEIIKLKKQNVYQESTIRHFQRTNFLSALFVFMERVARHLIAFCKLIVDHTNKKLNYQNIKNSSNFDLFSFVAFTRMSVIWCDYSLCLIENMNDFCFKSTSFIKNINNLDSLLKQAKLRVVCLDRLNDTLSTKALSFSSICDFVQSTERIRESMLDGLHILLSLLNLIGKELSKLKPFGSSGRHLEFIETASLIRYCEILRSINTTATLSKQLSANPDQLLVISKCLECQPLANKLIVFIAKSIVQMLKMGDLNIPECIWNCLTVLSTRDHIMFLDLLATSEAIPLFKSDFHTGTIIKKTARSFRRPLTTLNSLHQRQNKSTEQKNLIADELELPKNNYKKRSNPMSLSILKQKTTKAKKLQKQSELGQSTNLHGQSDSLLENKNTYGMGGNRMIEQESETREGKLVDKNKRLLIPTFDKKAIKANSATDFIRDCRVTNILGSEQKQSDANGKLQIDVENFKLTNGNHAEILDASRCQLSSRRKSEKHENNTIPYKMPKASEGGTLKIMKNPAIQIVEKKDRNGKTEGHLFNYVLAQNKFFLPHLSKQKPKSVNIINNSIVSIEQEILETSNFGCIEKETFDYFDYSFNKTEKEAQNLQESKKIERTQFENVSKSTCQLTDGKTRNDVSNEVLSTLQSLGLGFIVDFTPDRKNASIEHLKHCSQIPVVSYEDLTVNQDAKDDTDACKSLNLQSKIADSSAALQQKYYEKRSIGDINETRKRHETNKPEQKKNETRKRHEMIDNKTTQLEHELNIKRLDSVQINSLDDIASLALNIELADNGSDANKRRKTDRIEVNKEKKATKSEEQLYKREMFAERFKKHNDLLKQRSREATNSDKLIVIESSLLSDKSSFHKKKMSLSAEENKIENSKHENKESAILAIYQEKTIKPKNKEKKRGAKKKISKHQKAATVLNTDDEFERVLKGYSLF